MANFSYTIADAVAFTRIKGADWNARFSDLKSFFNTTNNINLSALQFVSNNGYPVGDATGQLGDSGGAFLPFFSNNADPSTPANNYIRLYSKSNKLYTINSVGTVALVGSGAGGGSINYIQNPDAESDLTGWVGYNETQQVTFTNGSINISITNADLTHFFLGQRIAFSTTGTLPTNFTQGTVYYVVSINPLSTSINVSATINGSSITAGSAGSGTHTLHPEEPYAGTGGSLSGLTFTRSLSSPLRGVASFLLTQSNPVPVNGQGVSYDFTIDSADQGRVLTVSFDYQASSDFVASSGQVGSQSDIQVYLYDVTNTQFIPISPNVITAKGSNAFTFSGEFQTPTTSTSYRLLVHVVTPNGINLGWTFKFDGVSVGPSSIPQGTPINDWTAFTPTLGAGFGTATGVSFFQRRVGDMLSVRGTFTAGTTAAALGSISLPAGMSLDISKLSTPSTSPGELVGTFASNSNADGTIVVVPNSSATAVYLGEYFNAGSSLVPDNVSNFVASGSVVSVHFQVPIAGWSSSTAMSSDADTRIVAAAIGLTTNYTVSANSPIKYDTVVYDTHASYSVSTGLYTAPVSGKYRVGAVGACTTLNQGYYVAVNGTAVTYVAASISTTIGGGSQTINAVAGDTIGIYSDVNNTTAGSSVPFSSFFSIERVSGPAAVAATETVAASVVLVAGTLSVSGNAAVIFDTKTYDTHNAYSVSTGLFTCPASGKYRVSHSGNVSSSSSGVYIAVNGSGTVYCGDWGVPVSSGGQTVSCKAGDTIGLFLDTGRTVVGGTANGAYLTAMSIERVGN